MSERCPTCGHAPRRAPSGRMKVRLAGVGAEWTAVAIGASRWYKRELDERYPAFEFRHERMERGPDFTIEARRR